MSAIARGAAFLLVFELYDASAGTLKIGASVTASQLSQDGAALGASTNAVSEIGGGLYSLQLTAGEMTATTVDVKVTATSCRAMTAHVTTDQVQADTDDLQTRLPAALVGGRMDAHVGSIADGLLSAAKFAADAFDGLLTRALSAVEGAATQRSLAWAIAKLTNKVALSGSTLSVKQTDDATNLFTQSVTTDGNQAPVVSVDTN